MEETIELEIPLLLPRVDDEKDQCLDRLERSLQTRKGILRAHLQREKSPVDLCLHYDPDLLDLQQVRRMAARAGAQISSRYQHLLLPIQGMDCSDCTVVLEHSLGRMPGILSVNVNYAAGTLRLEYDRQRIDRFVIEKRIRSLGYEIPLEGARSWYRQNRDLLFSLLTGVLVLAGWLGGAFWGLPVIATAAIHLAAYLLGGWGATRNALNSLRERQFDTDFLMVVAALGAAFLGQFTEGALLLFLFSLGHALEERALDHARRAVRALADLAPRLALVKRDGIEQELPVESLQLGDLVIVRPGVRIPVDGTLLAGSSGVDQSSVTGESMPVDKLPGDGVYAGTLNGEGPLEVKVTRLARDSTLARVMKMVEEAQSQRSPTQQTVEKFERVFVPGVLVLTLLVILLPPLFGFPFRESFLRAMTLLVAASPCALALGSPAAVLSGVAQAARNGVLIKGGAHLENLGRIRAIAFDKTGTLTHGQPEVTAVIALPGGGSSEAKVLSLAAGAESRSAHPLARAILRSARTRGISPAAMDEVQSLTGRGLRASLDGRTYWIGNQKLMEEAGVLLPADAIDQARSLEASGRTVMWVAAERVPLGLIALADTLRPEARRTVKALKKAGILHTIMLTGDNARSASAIAAELGMTEFRAGLLPGDKLTAIRELVREHGQVAMIGDGVNDAPALANATVGIAMGGAGTDVALETADVALMGDDLSRLPFAVGLGRAARGIITQNLFIALGVILLLVITSLTGAVSIGTAVILHEGSTLLVIVNALRLLGYRERLPG